MDGHSQPVAKFDHLTGLLEGTETWVFGNTMEVYLAASGSLSIVPPIGEGAVAAASDKVARLHLSGETYEIETLGTTSIWVNGSKVTSRKLKSGDVVEFGERGPISRFCLCSAHEKEPKTVTEIVAYTFAYLGASRQPGGVRAGRAGVALLRRLASETTILFRLGVVTGLAALGYLLFQQAELNAILQQDLAREWANIEKFSESLARARASTHRRRSGKLARTDRPVCECEC
jgi:hypothetical protein